MATRTSMLATLLVAGVAVVGVAPTRGSAQKLQVMVTNDDGVAAPGINALVEKLRTNPNLEIHVIAPATNQSGSGDKITTTSVTSTASSTSGAFPATAVGGFPGDTTLFGSLEVLPAKPDLVISGVNNGQNVTAEIAGLSGTIGAALWAGRLGIPAFAVSAGLGATPNYDGAAQYMATLVELFRKSKGFQKLMREKEPPFNGIVVNINFPTCTAGSVRGARVVPLGRLNTITGYTLLSDVAGVKTWKPTVVSGNYAAMDCTSTALGPKTDLEAMNDGFASVTPLAVERGMTGRVMRKFLRLERLF